MNKIKIVGSLIFFLFVAAALLFSYISTQNQANIASLGVINAQKSFTQEIAKSILYLHRNRGGSSKQLDINIQKFLDNKAHGHEGLRHDKSILKLWDEFYLLVQKFQKEQAVTTAYSGIVTDKLVSGIYSKNLKLVGEFDAFIALREKKHLGSLSIYKNIQYLLFVVVILLLLYLFTQVREVILFIQKFSTTSKRIIQNSTIQGLKPIELRKSDEDLGEVTKNFNHLVDQINRSIKHATKSIEHSTGALEEVEQNIEDFISLLSKMQNEETDELSQKEDAIIDSLETLMTLRKYLKSLKLDLEKLTI